MSKSTAAENPCRYLPNPLGYILCLPRTLPQHFAIRLRSSARPGKGLEASISVSMSPSRTPHSIGFASTPIKLTSTSIGLASACIGHGFARIKRFVLLLASSPYPFAFLLTLYLHSPLIHPHSFLTYLHSTSVASQPFSITMDRRTRPQNKTARPAAVVMTEKAKVKAGIKQAKTHSKRPTKDAKIRALEARIAELEHPDDPHPSKEPLVSTSLFSIRSHPHLSVLVYQQRKFRW
jgi:hypothetical protein